MLKVKIRNIEFNNPIMASSGTFGYGYEVDSFVDISKIGCVITKSITLKPREGNSSPRIHESESGMINSIGLANVGVEKFCKEKIPILNSINTKFIVSIAGENTPPKKPKLREIDVANIFPNKIISSIITVLFEVNTLATVSVPSPMTSGT